MFCFNYYCLQYDAPNSTRIVKKILQPVEIPNKVCRIINTLTKKAIKNIFLLFVYIELLLFRQGFLL